METATQTAKKSVQKNVYAKVNDKIIEQLENGKVPWLARWIEAGVPKGLINGWSFRGMNLMLTAMLGYEHNCFITEKQLEEIGGSIKAKERPHMLIHWNFPKEEEGGEIRPTKLGYYMVYNVAQCAGITAELTLDVVKEPDPILACRKVIEGIQNGPTMQHKDPASYYDPMEDYINIPKVKSFESEAHYYSMLFHQLAHSTGHHTRLDRMGIVQIPEYGTSPFTQEELVADIVTAYLQNLTGIGNPFPTSNDYMLGWAQKLRKDPYFIFTAYSLAQKAIDFILNVKPEEKTREE